MSSDQKYVKDAVQVFFDVTGARLREDLERVFLLTFRDTFDASVEDLKDFLHFHWSNDYCRKYLLSTPSRLNWRGVLNTHPNRKEYVVDLIMGVQNRRNILNNLKNEKRETQSALNLRRVA